jgi:replication protein O
MNQEALAPDFGRGFLRVPLSVWADLYCRTPLARRQLQLVSVVLRESWGWQKPGGEVYRWTRPLTVGQFAQATGLSTDHLTRDLQALIARGVLRVEAGRYQLVADPRLWKSHPTPPLKRRSRAPKHPASSAKTALLPSDVKTAKIRQRNVLAFPGEQLSTIVDNSPRGTRSSEEGEVSTEGALLEERFAAVVVTFAGKLSAREQTQLRQWIRRDGVSVVWASLETAFRRGPRALRDYLQGRLREECGTTI